MRVRGFQCCISMSHHAVPGEITWQVTHPAGGHRSVPNPVALCTMLVQSPCATTPTTQAEGTWSSLGCNKGEIHRGKKKASQDGMDPLCRWV